MLHSLVAACCLILGHVHTPTGAAIASAHVTVSGPTRAETTTDAKGDFSITAPPGRYALTATARGYATISVDTGDIVADSHVDVVMEPSDSPKLRTIGQVTVNGGYSLNRDTIPEMDVPRAQMEALGYGNVVEALGQVPSVVIQRPDGGSPAAPTVASLRGPDPSEALVTLDGHPLNDGNTGDLDLSQFAVPAFNGVSVTEGLGPADSEGSNTFGGAVNFVTLRPTQADRAALSGSIGSYGSSQMWLNATGTIGKLGYAFAGNNLQQRGQVDEYVLVTPLSNAPVYCGPSGKNTPTPNCPVYTHLGSTVSARLGVANLEYAFSQRADAGVRLFTLGDDRDESAALNGIAANPTCSLGSAPGVPCNFTSATADSTAPNPEYGEHVGAGSATFAQSIRAYDGYSRSVLGAGSLLADFFAADDNVDFSGGGASPYDVSHKDTRYNEALSWGRTFDDSEFTFGGYLRQEGLSGQGIDGTLSQSIDAYFVRGAQEIGEKLRLSGGLYDARYSTFGTSLDWRIGATYDLDSTSEIHASAGTGFRAPLLIERYFFPPIVGPHGKLEPNPGLPPMDSNCVVPGQGNPDERPEHATEYELGYSKLFSTLTSLDASVYRSNLRDTIENDYPGGGNVSYCGNKSPNGFVYEIPINIGNAVYEGAELRFKQRFPRQYLTMELSYGLNVAYPYALGPNVSNPTSGGTLVAYQQFLGVPQQQGSAMMSWAERGWHSAVAFTFAGRNNPLNQAPYTLTDAAVGKTFGHLDFTVAATNVFNSVSGPYTLYGVGVPYRGLGAAGPEDLATDRRFVQPAAIKFVLTVHE